MKGRIEKREDENGNEVWWLVGEHSAMRLWELLTIDNPDGIYDFEVGDIRKHMEWYDFTFEYQRFPEPHLVMVDGWWE